MALIGAGMRFAIVVNPNATAAQVRAYMPVNYNASEINDGTVIIHGRDNAGWTLDEYVIPRLGSGMVTAVELIPEREL